MTKRAFKNLTYHRACHEEIYIGQTESLANLFESPSQLDRFKKLGANCVCVYPVESEERRRAVEQDLIASHMTACNL